MSARLDPPRLACRRLACRLASRQATPGAALGLLLACALVLALASVHTARAAVVAPSAHATSGERAPSSEKGQSSLEAAAAKAGDTGRAVAMSLIGLAFAVAATVLAFRRDFKEAAGVFAIGIVAILLATPAGVNVLHDTVNTLFGA